MRLLCFSFELSFQTSLSILKARREILVTVAPIVLLLKLAFVAYDNETGFLFKLQFRSTTAAL
jgi:hypothetical protein